MPSVKTKTKSNRSPKAKSLYSVHPGVKMVQKWITDLPEKTGRSLEQWLKFVKREGPLDEKSRHDWLKDNHGMGTNAAWWIAKRAEGKGHDEDTPEAYLKSAERYVEDMFSGGKAQLRPMYERLLKLGLSIGPHAKACPCQTMVPLYRNHVFAQIKPTTNTRIDMGFALASMMKAGKKIPARLLDTGGFAKKDRITHRIPITSMDDIDDDVKKWMKTAYELDG